MAIKYAEIPELKKGVVFSDPWYDHTVWCQYRCDFQATDWLMKLETHQDQDILSFRMHLGRATMCSKVTARDAGEDCQISYPARYDLQSVELGIDTARIYCGNGENWDAAKEEAAIYTGADGLFGELMVFTSQGEQDPAGFLLHGSVDSMMLEEEDLYSTLLACFSGKELSKEQYEERTDPKNLSYKLILSKEIAHAQSAKQPPKNSPDKDTPER